MKDFASPTCGAVIDLVLSASCRCLLYVLLLLSLLACNHLLLVEGRAEPARCIRRASHPAQPNHLTNLGLSPFSARDRETRKPSEHWEVALELQRQLEKFPKIHTVLLDGSSDCLADIDFLINFDASISLELVKRIREEAPHVVLVGFLVSHVERWLASVQCYDVLLVTSLHLFTMLLPYVERNPKQTSPSSLPTGSNRTSAANGGASCKRGQGATHIFLLRLAHSSAFAKGGACDGSYNGRMAASNLSADANPFNNPFNGDASDGADRQAADVRLQPAFASPDDGGWSAFSSLHGGACAQKSGPLARPISYVVVNGDPSQLGILNVAWLSSFGHSGVVIPWTNRFGSDEQQASAGLASTIFNGDAVSHELLFRLTRVLVDISSEDLVTNGLLPSYFFNALAAGAFVITNNHIGSREVFGRHVPMWTASSLSKTLHHYLSQPDQAASLQKQVHERHTYAHRAKQLYNLFGSVKYLICQQAHTQSVCKLDLHHLMPGGAGPNVPTKGFDFCAHNVPGSNSNSNAGNTQRICIIVRVHDGTPRLQLQALLLSLLGVSSQQPQIFIVNTDHYSFGHLQSLNAVVQSVNQALQRCAVQLLEFDYVPLPHVYGYDYTDSALQQLLAWRQGARSASHEHRSHVPPPYCTYFIFTNGDNLYHADLFSKLAPSLALGKLFVAWDFTSHHPRQTTHPLAGMMPNQPISVELKRGFVDLGSVLVHHSLLQRASSSTPVLFLPQGVQTEDLFARDWHLIAEVLEGTPSYKVELVHEVLMFHQ